MPPGPDGGPIANGAGAPAPAVAPPPGNPRFALMDSLRAIAALGVLVGHVGFITHTQQTHWYGAIMSNFVSGVAIFFVLSGFLLYRPFFSSELAGTPRPRLRDYTRRRLLRIVPAYWLALTLLAIEPGLSGVFTHDWWRYYGFLQIYDSFTRDSGLTVAWTLCIEVTFYLVLPFYAALTRRIGRGTTTGGRTRIQLAMLGVLGLTSILLGVARDPNVTPSVLSYFDWFAIGMSLAVLSVALQGRARPPAPVAFISAHPGAVWGIGLVVYLVLCAVLSSAPAYAYYSPAQTIIEHVGEGAVALLLVLPAVFGDHSVGWPRRLLGNRRLMWMGGISYGIYLWHLSVAQWLFGKGATGFVPLLVATVIGTTVIAAASYYLVERPILRFKEGRRRGRAAVAAPPILR